MGLKDISCMKFNGIQCVNCILYFYFTIKYYNSSNLFDLLNYYYYYYIHPFHLFSITHLGPDLSGSRLCKDTRTSWEVFPGQLRDVIPYASGPQTSP